MTTDKPLFDECIDDVLLANGFKYYDDWEYGPQAGWSTDWEHYTIRLNRHSFGYWVNVIAHSGGENKHLCLGSSNSADDILALKNLLEKFF